MDSPAVKKKLYEDVDIRSELYQSKYPELKNIRQNADVNIIKNNLLVGCKHDYLRCNDKQVLENNTVIQADGKKPEEICMQEFLKQYGLQPIPISQTGPQGNLWLKQSVSN